MPSVLVRNVSESVLRKLKVRASRSGRSLQSEVQTILQEAVRGPESLSGLEAARRIRNSLDPKKQTDSTQLLREDRSR